jgi:glutamate-1-semialdehyde 2,1-aminomutase
LISLKNLKNNKGIAMYNYAKKLMPGGTQLLSKRPEMFAPDIWPSYYEKAKGCRIWDLEGNKFIDMSIMSVGACLLGYADDDVDDAVIRTIRDGSNSTLNCIEDVKLAEALIELHPWFGMVRYARSGGEAMAIAVRIARAYTNRDVVFFSGYHGWNDWYLAANLSNDSNLDGQLMPGLKPNGIPRALEGTSIPFEASNIESLRKKIKGKEKTVAAIIIEPARGEEASKDYLKNLRDLASEIGAVLLFDEITSGYRMCAGGIHRNYGIYPDIAVLAKSMANGYPMSAVMGTEKVMEAAQTSFISSTNWTDRIGPTASLATLKKYQFNSTEKHLIKIGNKVKDIWRKTAKLSNIDITVSGLPSLASFSFNSSDKNTLNTIFTVEMLKRNILGFRQFKPSLAHTDNELKIYEKAVNEVFKLLSSDLKNYEKDFKNHHESFVRLTKE